MKTGRPINIKAINEVLRYRKLGLGVREIARLMSKDPTQVMRWISYVDKRKVTVDK